MDVGILTKLLQTFIGVFTAGQARIIPDAVWMLQALATIEIILLGIWYLWTRDIDITTMIAKVIAIVVFAWIIGQWPMITKVIVRSFVQAGLKAGGDAISETDMTDPSNIAQYGMSVTAVVFQHLQQYTGMDALYNIVEILFSGWAALAVVLCYFVMAIWIFVVLLEFYAFTAIGVLLIPFGIFKYTAFLAEKTFAALCAAGVQVLVLSFITSAALPVMITLQTGMNPTFAQVLIMFLGALALLALAWRANKFAVVLLQGAPQLSVHDVTRVAQTTVVTLQQLGTQTASLREGASNLMRRRS